MTHTLTANVVRGVLPAAAALLVVGATPAQGAVQEARTGDWLYLTVTRGDARSGEPRSTLLRCDPPQGHRRAAEACNQLDAVDGDIGRIPLKDGYCPMVYAPVTAHARGQWKGRPIEYRETFTNTCALVARTGAVFVQDR
jgi:hypothetical protein